MMYDIVCTFACSLVSTILCMCVLYPMLLKKVEKNAANVRKVERRLREIEVGTIAAECREACSNVAIVGNRNKVGKR